MLQKWGPIIIILLLVILAWYVVFGLALVPAYLRASMGTGIELEFDGSRFPLKLQIFV